MLLTGSRRIILIAIVLLLVIYYIGRVTKVDDNNRSSSMLYKVRAYVTSREDAQLLLKVGRRTGFKGSVSKGKGTIKKFKGYIVAQDFARNDPEYIQYIAEFLANEGIENQVEDHPDGKTVTIRARQFFSDEDSAQKLAGTLQKKSFVTFKVMKYMDEVPYKAYIVVFQNIDTKEKAEKLKVEIEKICSEVELISY